MSAARDEFDILTTLQRRPAGVTQQATACAMGVSRQYVEQLENDKRKPSLATACEWARARGYRLALVPVEG